MPFIKADESVDILISLYTRRERASRTLTCVSQWRSRCWGCGGPEVTGKVHRWCTQGCPRWRTRRTGVRQCVEIVYPE